MVIYGSRISGAPVLAEELQKYLQAKGLNNPLVEIVRDVAAIENAFYDVSVGENIDSIKFPHNLPEGVVIFPQMRQYSGGMGMSINSNTKGRDGMSIIERIQQLCQKNYVPCIIIDDSTTNEELPGKLNPLLPPAKE